MPAAVLPLPENRGLAFHGDQKRGAFVIPATRARRFLAAPNAHGKPNRDVVRPWAGAIDILRTPQHRWIIDFPPGMEEREAVLYSRPFAYVRRRVKPVWGGHRTAWWIHGAAQSGMRVALAKRDRFLATPALARHRLFAWLPPDTLPNHGLIVFARDDDWFFGVLHSRCHEVWTRRTGTPLGAHAGGVRYKPTACFETFPFPWPPAMPLGKLTRVQEDQRTTIGHAARGLDAQRCEWLGDRSDPKRTLTALYNARPTWLRHAHAALNDAVATAYGWPADLSDDALVSNLLALNQERSSRP
jgi:hypothetical protein